MSALLALLLLAIPAASAQEVATSPGAACAADYERGAYADAAACYRALEAAGHHNGHLHYNEGNAWYRAGDTGRAVLAYRRAELYLPRDGDVRANLAAARRAAKDDLEPPDSRGAFARAVLAPYDGLSPRELLLLGSVAWALFFSLLALRVRRDLPGGAGPLVLLGILAAAALIGWSIRSYELATSPVAVVLGDEVTLRSGRDLQSVDLARLHAGAEVTVVEEGDAWVQVALSSGQRGWMPASELGLVRP
jgi:tetratricopeptide (TPR) repeat protein